MKVSKNAAGRFVGIDLGKRTYELAILGIEGKVAFSNGQTFPAGRQSLYKKLRAEDTVALEAGNMAFIMAKEIGEAVGCRVYVLNAHRLALIYASMKKTDREDALKLARIVQYFPEDRLPIVPLPSDQEMRRRKILACYRRSMAKRSRAVNQLHGLFVSQGITTKARKDLATAGNRAEAVSELTGIEREEAEFLLDCLAMYESRIGELKKQIEKESEGDEAIEQLQSIPGVGPMTAFAFIAHVAVERFENASQVSNYLGLTPRVYMSGEMERRGRITKRGNGYVRGLLVQAAWALTFTKSGGKLKERFEYMTVEKSISKKKAIVAIARRIAEVMYALLRDGVNYEERPFKGSSKEKAELAAQLVAEALAYSV